jgi:hypothetical protein
MGNIAVKLVASSLLISAASLVGHRWDQSGAGWLVGLPLISGPVAFLMPGCSRWLVRHGGTLRRGR